MSWNSKLATELHRPVSRKFRRRRVFATGQDKIWASDLADFQKLARHNRGYKYLLVCIDIFSKYLWLVPLKNKTGLEVAKALESLFKTVRPTRLWCDYGKEYWNNTVEKLLKKYGITLYRTYNEGKSVVAERVIRTIKTWIYKRFTTDNTDKWIDMIDSLAKTYNEKIHRSIGISPSEARKIENTSIVFKKLFPKQEPEIPKFKLNDIVRISKLRGHFRKGYLPSWSSETFKIKTVKDTVPVTYEIEDLQGNEITGSFYEKELQLTDQKVFWYKKLKSRVKNGQKQIYVNWMGYPPSQNSWINESDIV